MILWLKDGLIEATSNWRRAGCANTAHAPIANRISAGAVAVPPDVRRVVDGWPNSLAMRSDDEPPFAAVTAGRVQRAESNSNSARARA